MARIAWLGFALVLSGCTMAGGGPDPTDLFGSGGGGPSDLRSNTAGISPQAGARSLGSDELFSIYQTIINSYVDRVDGSSLVIGAFKGAHSGALESGLLPADTALLDEAPVQMTGNPQGDWAQFGSAYDSFLRKLGTRGADVGNVGQAAVRGMVSALPDPLSDYLDSSELGRRQSPRVANVGLVLAPSEIGGSPVVRQILRDSPADRAGAKIGDSLRAVDGNRIDGVDFYAVLQQLSGSDGSAVTLTLAGPGGVAHDVALQRARLPSPQVSTSLRGAVEYIQVPSLDQGAA
ncbi:MAG TPA: PDZ domain-containing protein, partial [Chloroflexota bacterium]